MDNTMCLKIHELINKLPIYDYKNIDRIPFDDGIYFVFEDGENYHNFKRITRVGINQNGNKKLKDRLKNHYRRKNHGNSVFIKHVGRVFLNMDSDNYIKIWNIKSPGAQKDTVKENYYENKTSQYIQNHTSVAIIEVKDYKIRKRLEDALISTLHNTNDFKQSPNWLGNNSPEEKIRESGMWVIHGLKASVMNNDEFNLLINLINKAK